MLRAGPSIRRHVLTIGFQMILVGIAVGWAISVAAAGAPNVLDAHAARRSAGSAASGVKQVAYDGSGHPTMNVGSALNTELDQLKQERSSLAAVRTAPIGEPVTLSASVQAEREKLKKQLQGLVKELANQPRPEETPAGGAKGASKSGPRQQGGQPKNGRNGKSSEGLKHDGSHGLGAQGPIDAMALGQALFRTGNYAESLKAFELAKKTVTDPRDRAVIKYLSAACLGKLGNAQESTTLFREVANSKADEVLAECARWQLSVQQWREATTARIAQLRAIQAARSEAGDPESASRGEAK